MVLVGTGDVGLGVVRLGKKNGNMVDSVATLDVTTSSNGKS